MAQPEDWAPHLGSWLMTMTMEVLKQAEWGEATGRRLLDGTSDNEWIDIQSFAAHSGSVGAFLHTLGMRSNAIARLYPDRSTLMRELTRSGYDFRPIMNVRNGIAHVDERIEELWPRLAADREEPPGLSVRLVGPLNDGRERMLNWDPETKTIAFRRTEREGGGFDQVSVEELVGALSDLQAQGVLGFLWLAAGAPTPEPQSDSGAGPSSGDRPT